MTGPLEAAGIRTEVREGVGTITLTRVPALNALTTPMVAAIAETLDRWRAAVTEGTLSVVVIDSASPKAFCAGGDIRAVRENSLADDRDASEEFFASEYALNAALAEYPVPVVALIDGICMGGGLGLSVHGAFRVVTERAVLAMPETRIGFFPDIGASHFLPRLPGALGTYIGLTGVHLRAVDALHAGLATHFVAADRVGDVVPELRAGVAAGRETAAVLAGLATLPDGESDLATHRRTIDHCFGTATFPDVRVRLTAAAEDGSDFARATLATLDELSPASLLATFDLLQRGAGKGLRDCLADELALTRTIIRTPDFIEGVRAALVDKDRAPRWQPAG